MSSLVVPLIIEISPTCCLSHCPLISRGSPVLGSHLQKPSSSSNSSGSNSLSPILTPTGRPSETLMMILKTKEVISNFYIMIVFFVKSTDSILLIMCKCLRHILKHVSIYFQTLSRQIVSHQSQHEEISTQTKTLPGLTNWQTIMLHSSFKCGESFIM